MCPYRGPKRAIAYTKTLSLVLRSLALGPRVLDPWSYAPCSEGRRTKNGPGTTDKGPRTSPRGFRTGSALCGDGGDQRLDVAERVGESLLAVDPFDLRDVVGHHHAVVADFAVDTHRLEHVDAAVVDEG